MKWLIFLLLGGIMIGAVNAEILDARNERACSGGSCTLTSYTSDRFEYYDNDWRTFDYMLQPTLSDTNSRFTFKDGTDFTLRPYVILNEVKTYLDSNALISYNPIFDRKRDEVKFAFNIVKVNGLTEIGFDIVSLQPLRTNTYEHLPEGVYNLAEEDLPYINITDYKIGNRGLSFIDLIESGFDVIFTSTGLEIDLTSLPNGLLNLDPILKVYSDSQDGHCIFTLLPKTCSNCVSGTTTNVMGMGAQNIEWDGLLTFDTSSIPDDATVGQVNLSIYAQSLTQQSCGGAVHAVNYLYNQDKIGASLTCSDVEVDGWTGNSPLSFDWGTSTGWKNNSNINLTSVNVDGDTDFIFAPGWAACPNARTNNYFTWRASEYAGTSSDPFLNVSYALPEVVKPILVGRERAVYPLAVILAMMFIATRKNGKKESISDG